MTEPTELDAIVVGGGIAGLWTLNALQGAGYRAVLLEATALGQEQTLASQGMIHGGLKYALRGQLTGASEAIAAMPDRWRACLAGRAGEVDLSGLEPLSERYYLFAEASTLGRLTTFFASKSLRGRIDKLNRSDYPLAFQAPGFNGVVYGLNDFVLDTPALLARLQRNVAAHSYQHQVQGSNLSLSAEGVTLRDDAVHLRAQRLILTAGAGTGALLKDLNMPEPVMQRRPLHQVLVRHKHQAPLFAHCLTGVRRAEPRLTITSHSVGDSDGEGDHWLWYLGGQLATDGVERSTEAQIAFARQELDACVPWLDWRDAEIETLRVDRAEPAQTDSQRPDEAYVSQHGAVIVGWPTKLSLVPDLGDRVLAAMPAAAGLNDPAPLALPAVQPGTVPWERTP